MELQRIEMPTPTPLPFAEGEDLTPAAPSGDATVGKLWQMIASNAVLPAPDADKLKTIEPLLATVKQRATAPRAFEPPNLTDLCGTFPGLFKRLPTGFPAFDAHTGGGFQTSRVIIVGGAPGAHKTSLLTRMAYAWAREGVVVNGEHQEVLVVIFATDEPRHGFLSRIGQIEGLVRADLDNEDTAISGTAWATVGERLRSIPNLMIFDARFDAVTVEDLVEKAAERAQGRRVVFIVDSLQSAPFRSDAEGHEGARVKIEARMKAAVNLAIKHRVLFIATSELNRGSYRSRAQAEQVADLAAFKESSGIEYGADLGILLRSVPGEPNKVEVSIAKNRMGESDVLFRLERGAHFTYTEAPMPEGEGGGSRRGGEVDDEGRRQRKILEAVRISPEPLRSASDVYRITKGTKTAILATFRKLMDEGRIVNVNGALRVAMPKETAREESSPEDTPSDRFERFEPVREPPNHTSVRPVRAVRAPVGGEPPNRTDGGGVIEPATGEPIAEPAAEPAATGDPLAGAKAAILRVLRNHPDAPNLDAVRLYTGRDFPTWKLRLAWTGLQRAGAIENQGTAKAPSWSVAERSAAQEEAEPPS